MKEDARRGLGPGKRRVTEVLPVKGDRGSAVHRGQDRRSGLSIEDSSPGRTPAGHRDSSEQEVQGMGGSQRFYRS